MKNENRVLEVINRYKTLLGFGLLFNRIKKLCGTSNGKIYPSLTLDQNGNHTPVAMSTALYSISILHEITNQCFDYWGVYEFKYGVASSLIDSNVRVKSELDDILVELIKSCWDQILHFGGAAAQEKTKNVKMWELVKGNIIISENFIRRLKPYLVSPKTIEKRNSKVSSNEYEIYFDQLNELLSNDAKKLFILLNATNNHSKFKSVYSEISNFISRLSNGNHNLIKKKVHQIFQEYDKFILAQLDFNVDFQVESLEINMDLNEIYRNVFLNSENFIEDLTNKNVNPDKIKKVVEIIEKLYREYALSLNDLKFLDQLVNR